jgi:hypothetical protein
MGLSEEIGAEGPPLWVELLRLVPEAEKHLLNDLLGRCPSPEHPGGQGENGPGVAPIDLGERLLSPAADRDHEGRVARLAPVVDAHHSRFVTETIGG